MGKYMELELELNMWFKRWGNKYSTMEHKR